MSAQPAQHQGTVQTLLNKNKSLNNKLVRNPVTATTQGSKPKELMELCKKNNGALENKLEIFQIIQHRSYNSKITKKVLL